MAIKSRIHKRKINKFINHLIEEGWTLEENKRTYECFRVRKNGRLMVTFKNNQGTEHITIQDKDIDIINEYLKKMKKIKKAIPGRKEKWLEHKEREKREGKIKEEDEHERY